MSSVVLGDFEVSLVRESVYWWDGGAFFGVVPKTMWSARIPADELNRIPAGFNSYLIRTGEHVILIETGGGDKMNPRARERMKLAPEQRPLGEAIAARGIDPESIDIVINSHLHWDHCGGNTIRRGGAAEPAFPRARYFAPKGEWEHAHERHIRDSVSYIDDNYDPLVNSGRMTLVEGDCEIVPGVRMRPAPGHNRDMTIVTAESRGQTFCFLSDMVPTSAHLQPSWVAAFDLFPVQAIDTKLLWLRRAMEGKWVCGFAHDVNLDFARIMPDAKTTFAAMAAEAV
jgi:glyoxylase-like metal-dependent hydrolase (beta-lactamase superfamily II)